VHENHTFLAVVLAPLLLGVWPRARTLLAATSTMLFLNLFLVAVAWLVAMGIAEWWTRRVNRVWQDTTPAEAPYKVEPPDPFLQAIYQRPNQVDKAIEAHMTRPTVWANMLGAEVESPMPNTSQPIKPTPTGWCDCMASECWLLNLDGTFGTEHAGWPTKEMSTGTLAVCRRSYGMKDLSGIGEPRG